MKISPRPIKPHHRARLVLWARTMLAWVVMAWVMPAVRANRRHMRLRTRFMSVYTIEHLVSALIMTRAMEIVRPRSAYKAPRDATSDGFRRRVRRGARMRAVYGSRLRKTLRRRNLMAHIERLCEALADIDGFARRYFVPRVRRRLTKLYAIIMRAPPADVVACLAAHKPCAADTS